MVTEKKSTHLIVQTYLKIISALAQPLIRMNIPPSIITWMGLIVGIFAGALFWTGHLFFGGVALLFAGMLDNMDGVIARTSGKVSNFGALLDSTLDRYCDFAVFLGLFGYISHSDTQLITFYQVVVMIALIGSVVVSYVRARAEGLGFSCNLGFFQRPSRVITIAVAALITSAINPIFDRLNYSYLHDAFLKLTIVLLAIGTNATAMRRLWASMKVMNGKDKM